MNFTALKSSFAPSVLALSLVIAAFSPGARAIAQDSSLHLTANVPFDFRSGSEMMPAGKYDIRQLSDHILIVRGVNQNRSQFVSTQSTQTFRPSEKGKLVFHRYGNQYFLYQIWSPGESSGYELPKSHAEKETLRAANNPAPTTSELALSVPPGR